MTTQFPYIVYHFTIYDRVYQYKTTIHSNWFIVWKHEKSCTEWEISDWMTRKQNSKVTREKVILLLLTKLEDFLQLIWRYKKQ